MKDDMSVMYLEITMAWSQVRIFRKADLKIS